MKYLSVCSGIEAATAAWHPLGWRPWAFSQFDPDHKGKGPDFPSAVLAHHYPDVPNLGDMTKFKDWPDATLDVLVGGTPCQSFSVAGLRGGLDDERGNLMLVYCAIAPGGWQSAGVVDGYRGAYGLAWRVLDSQFVRVDGFGRAVPQRRRRVFVVGYIGGDWRRAAAVLFERASMSGDSPPRRNSRQSVAGTLSSRPTGGGGLGTDFDLDGGIVPEVSLCLAAARGGSKALDTSMGTYVAAVSGTARAARSRGAANADQAALIPEVSPPLMASGIRTGGDRPPGGDADTVLSLIPEVANPLARMHKGVNTTMDEGQTMIGEPMVFDETQITHPENRSQPRPGGPSHALAAGARPPAIAFTSKDYGADASDDVAPTLRAGGFTGSHANGGIAPAIAFNARQDSDAWEDRTGPLDTDGGTQAVVFAEPVSFDWQAGGGGADASFRGKSRSYIVDRAGATRSLAACKTLAVATNWIVRRLTPEECERLQGFADGFTNIPWRGKSGAPDGPRYKALGNSFSVNVVRWIGVRIEMVEKICGQDQAVRNSK